MVGACQQNSGIFLVRGGGPGLEICGGRGRDWERSGTGRDAGGDRGRDWDEIPAGAEAGTGRDADGDRG